MSTIDAQTQVSFASMPSIRDDETLQHMIDRLKKEGVTLELIILLIMSNPHGTGAMDLVSSSIAGITQQSSVLSQVQSDIITLNSILSKIESQLGTKASVTESMWNKFPKSLLKEFKDTYQHLFVGNTANPDGKSDIETLKTYEEKFPTLKPVVTGIENWQKDDFNTGIPSPNYSSFDTDVQDWDGQDMGYRSTAFSRDLCTLAKWHYEANHPTSGGGKTGATDYLQNWWTDGNADQQLVSGQSQQDTTQVQAYMQLLQGFDSSAQQDIQLASTQKSLMIQNEKTS